MKILSFLNKTPSQNATFQINWLSLMAPIATGICILTIVVVGFVLLQIGESQSIHRNQQQSAKIGAILASEIEIFIRTQISLLESLSQSPSLGKLFKSRDQNALTARESELTYLFPGVLRVRLLLPGINQVQEDTQPPLGYAALALLRESEAGRISPAEVHLASGGKRNIALTRPVLNDTDKSILGHILIQSSLDPLFGLLDVESRTGNFVVLVQIVDLREVKLYQKGNNSDQVTTATAIPGTSWRLLYAPNLSNNNENQIFQVGGLLGVIAAVVALALFLVQFIFTQALNEDLITIVNVLKDLQNGRTMQKYAVRFAVINGTIEVMQRLLQIPAAVSIPRAAGAAVALTKQRPLPVPSEAVSSPLPLTIEVATPVTSPAPAVPIPVAEPLNNNQTPETLNIELATEATNIPVAPSVIPIAIIPTAIAPITVAPQLLELLDLFVLDSHPHVDTPKDQDPLPLPIPKLSSTASGLLDLSLLDSDFSDLKPTNKSTITLPSSSTAASFSLDLDQDAVTPATTLPPPEIFRAYDIRGVVNDSLTDAGAHAIGRAIGSEAQERDQHSVVVARDGRISSPKLVTSLIRGIRDSGCNVSDIGQVPTPLLYFATDFLKIHAGVMLTASHNPPDWNGMKVVLGGETLSGEGIQKLRQRIETGQLLSGEGNLQSIDVVPAYLDQVTADIQLARPLRVVVDCGNGVAGTLAPRLYRALRCEVEELFCEVDGNFPNHLPDPSQPQNLLDLITTVKARHADLGIAFDGDGDRLVVVAGNGGIIWPDRLMMLFAEDLLSRNPGATIIFDVKSSALLPRVIKQHGGRPLMWKTGHSLIKAKMQEVGALFAGEMSGHLFFKERWFGFDDGLYAGARLLELLSHDQRAPSNVFADLPDAVSTSELRIDLPEGESNRLMKSLAVARTRITGAEITTIDGLRADFEEGWGLVRASNTTPSLVFRFEANTPRALRRVQDEFRRILLEVGPGLKLPF